MVSAHKFSMESAHKFIMVFIKIVVTTHGLLTLKVMTYFPRPSPGTCEVKEPFPKSGKGETVLFVVFRAAAKFRRKTPLAGKE